MTKIKRWWRGLGEWTRFTILLIGVPTLFYVVEDTRGYLVLLAAKEQLRAEGFRLDPDDYNWGSVPDEKNFAASNIIRDAYRGQRELISSDVLPYPLRESLSDSNPHGFHGSDIALEDYFDPPIDRNESLSILRKGLGEARPRMMEWEKAVSRPECDWSAVIDRFDQSDRLNHITLLQEATIAFRTKAQVAFAEKDSESAARSVLVLLRGPRMMMTETGLVSYTIGLAISRVSLAEVATGLENQIWNGKELNSILKDLRETRERLDRKPAFEVEAASIVALSGEIRKLREMYSSAVSFFNDDFIDLPSFSFWINTDDIEESINRLIYYLIPRGWFWLSNADYLRSMSSGTVQDSIFLRYPSSGPLFQKGHVKPMISRIEETSVLFDLAIQAFELEQFYGQNGVYPSTKEFIPPSENFGYVIGENGRPVLWYSETGPAGAKLDPADYETIPEHFLWRYR